MSDKVSREVCAERLLEFERAANDLARVFEEHIGKVKVIKAAEKVYVESLRSKATQYGALSKKCEKRVEKIIDELTKTTGKEFEKHVTKIFNTVFNKMRSRTLEVVTMEDVVITIGESGFGLRKGSSKRSRAVEDSADVAVILRNVTTVIDGLNTLKLPQFAERLKVFNEIVPVDILGVSDGMNKVFIDLKNKVYLSFDGRYSGIEEMRRLAHTATRICFSTKYGQLFQRMKRSHRMATVVSADEAQSQDLFSYDVESVSDECLFVWFQIASDMEEYVQTYEERMRPAIEKSKGVLEKLNKEFGRELLLSEL